MKIDIVTADADMVRQFYGRELDHTARMIAALNGERVLGIFGLVPKGAWNVAILDMTDELRAHPKAIIRAWQIVRRWIAESRLPVCATCDESIEGARRFLAHFGFRPTEGGIYLCQEA